MYPDVVEMLAAVALHEASLSHVGLDLDENMG
jgi:hypothetical protein